MDTVGCCTCPWWAFGHSNGLELRSACCGSAESGIFGQLSEKV